MHEEADDEKLPNKKYFLLSSGSNSAGQLGIGHDEDSHIWQTSCCQQSSEETFPPFGWKIDQLSSGAGHTVALLAKESKDQERQIWVSGQGTDGQLGLLRRAKEPTDSSFTQLNLVNILQDVNENQLLNDLPQWTPKLIECGWDFTLIVLETKEGKEKDDILLVLGKNNDFLQLGISLEESRASESGLSIIKLRDLLFEREYKGLRPRVTIDSIASGLRHSTVVCSSINPTQHWLVGWGACRHGQLGKIEENPIRSGSRMKTPASSLPRIIGSWKSDGEGTDNRGIQLAAGKEHSVIYIPDTWKVDAASKIDIQHGLACLGSNRSGQCALNGWSQENSSFEVGSTWNGTFIANQKSFQNSVEILGCGNGEKGQLGTGSFDAIVEGNKVHKVLIEKLKPDSSLTFIQLACGSEHVAILVPMDTNDNTSDNQTQSKTRILGWGWNEHGNLAQDDEIDRQLPVQIWPPLSPELMKDSVMIKATAVNVWAGCGTTFVQVYM